MRKREGYKRINCLTIAGFDPSGGAGIVADIKVFQRLGAYGLSVITALTIQNTQAVFGIQTINSDVVFKQLKKLSDDIDIDAVKIGMLYSKDVVKAVVDFLTQQDKVIVVLDTPIVSSSGMPLIDKEALRLMKRRLIPLSTVITPNIPEAEVLTGVTIRGIKDIQQSARLLHQLG
ncbi:MAG: hydroxymethylpyrimidine/phosphomethylpyrimidine kinase, partial [Thermodesulfovibrionales bacterium]